MYSKAHIHIQIYIWHEVRREKNDHSKNITFISIHILLFMCLIKLMSLVNWILIIEYTFEQLESVKGVERSTLPKEETSPSIDKSEPKIKNGNQEGGGGNGGVEEEIMKELKAVKRQNTITHCLLSALIVVTLIWELSEVSLVLKLRDGMNHPFRSFGSLLAGMLPSPGKINVVGNGDDKDGNDQNIFDPLLPSVRMPELPHVEFPHMGSNDEE